jgi:hypothetical protein
MTIQTSFHAAKGHEFLGMRLSRRGEVEVVYDSGAAEGGVAERRVWRVMPQGQEAAGLSWREEQALSEGLRIAAGAPRVLVALYDEMKKRALLLENA